jgi:GT2 family glycosyltransferase
VIEVVTFVIPTYRRPDALRQTLERVTVVEHPPDALEVIVVDNAGERATQQVVAAFGAGSVPVRYERAPEGGAAAARNHGARVARGELLILLDDDILIEPSHVARHLELRSQYGDCVSGGDWRLSDETVTALQRTPFGRFRLELDRRYRGEEPGERLDSDRCEVPMLAACNLALVRDRFLELGGFDERFPYAGVEDRELSMRMRVAGLRLIRDDSIRMVHNDQLLTLEQFCAREQRSAATVAVLARIHPEADRGRAFAAVNGHVSRADPPGLVARKLVKRALVGRAAVATTRRALRTVEPVLSDRVLARLYAALVGVYIQQGFRDGAQRRLRERAVDPSHVGSVDHRAAAGDRRQDPGRTEHPS